ncbi:hypothetical protein ON010_g8905 [Phytophthora cinnamomi]|nr:hypothetical protein ON010_g8905 [Phytophthora cinnamomi]
MQVFRFLVVAAVAAITIGTVASTPEADSNTAEQVSDNALDVILGASSQAGSIAAGTTTVSGSGSNSASSVVVAGIATTAMVMAAAMLI